MNTIKPTLPLILLVIISTTILFGCNRPQEYKFEVTKKGTNKAQSFGPPIIKSYSAGYNPKAYGNIIITMSDGTEYKALGLEPANMTLILQLLALKSMQIDVANNELTVKGVTP